MLTLSAAGALCILILIEHRLRIVAKRWVLLES